MRVDGRVRRGLVGADRGVRRALVGVRRGARRGLVGVRRGRRAGVVGMDRAGGVRAVRLRVRRHSGVGLVRKSV